MKLLSIFVAAICAGTAAAQGITIGFPTKGANVTLGQQLTINIIKNNHIISSIEAGMVIGILSCPAGNCSPQNLGTILYNGPYNPQSIGGRASQNITVTIPTTFSLGPAQLAFARFFLIGAGNSPTIGGANVTVNIV